MENPIENEKYIRLMSRYLSYVVILGLSFFVWKQYQDLLTLVKDTNKEKEDAIHYWREAYRKSSETYLLMIQKQQDENNSNNRDR